MSCTGQVARPASKIVKSAGVTRKGLSSNVRRYAAAAGSASRATPQTIQTHLNSLVHASDYPNYLCTSFYPSQEARYDYLAIRAFNVEVSTIADSVSNPQLGRLRFQWWRDAIQSLNKETPVPHPTVIALHRAHRRQKLSLYHFNRVIDAKERNMLDPTYSTLSDLTNYAQASTLPLLMLQLQSLFGSFIAKGEVEDIPLSAVDHSLSHLATFISIARMLQSLHYFAGKKRSIVIPRDIGAEHGLVDEQIFRSLPYLDAPPSSSSDNNPLVPGTSIDPQIAIQPLIAASEELVSLAQLERLKSRWTLGLPSAKGEPSPDEEHQALAQGRHLSKLPGRLVPLYLSAIPAQSFLNEFINTAHCNPLHPSVRVQSTRNWKLPWQIMWSNWRGTY